MERRRTYDTRVKYLVRTGLLPDVYRKQIHKSLISKWKREDPSKYYGYELSENVDHLYDVLKTVAENEVIQKSVRIIYRINKVLKESGITFNQGKPLVNLTANFPVTLMTWFFRNKNYESTSNLYFDSRYNYGYTTKYINTSTLTFPSGVTNYIDVIDNAKITLNNIDILSNFPGSLYFSFQQPMQHKLSIPSKNIYMYSFGLNPKEYNQGGYLNFAKLNSQTTTLSISFLPQYSSQIISGYNLYVFYYGYTLLQFDNGFASLPYL
jgi:hypothetical protein